MRFSVGDRCRDNNRTWPRYGQTGTVVSTNGNNISWRSDTDGKLVTDSIGDMENIMRRPRRRKNYRTGGLLQGPSHERGGIPIKVLNGPNIEAEGGEWVISKPVVDLLGNEFFEKLNRTGNPYLNGGGFKPGELSMNGTPVYRRGGRIYRHGSRIRRGNNRRYHEGGAVQGPNGQWMYVLPHDHPHSLPGSGYPHFDASQELPGTPQTPGHIHPGRPRSIGRKRPIPRPIGPGGPSGHIPHPGVGFIATNTSNSSPGVYRHGGLVGSPNSCLDGRGNNVPC